MTLSSSHQPDTLSRAERLGSLAVMAALTGMAGFFWLHQAGGTGFFTAEFGPLSSLCLYGPIGVALLPPAVRALTGRRHPAYLPEAAANLSLALGTLWLLITFPFDFSHLGDVLPLSLRPLLGWVTDDLGRIPMFIQVIFMPISAAINVRRSSSPPRRPALGSS